MESSELPLRGEWKSPDLLRLIGDFGPEKWLSDQPWDVGFLLIPCPWWFLFVKEQPLTQIA